MIFFQHSNNYHIYNLIVNNPLLGSPHCEPSLFKILSPCPDILTGTVCEILRCLRGASCGSGYLRRNGTI